MSSISVFKAFRIVVERQDFYGRATRTVVQVRGEVDVATSDHLAAAIARAMASAMEKEPAGKFHLVIDLARLTFIDVSGINVLVRAEGQARACGGALVLRSPSRSVRRLLDVLRLDAVLAVE
jgi:stage II sporulation protein AA (anti-sigma F factor antagonist)